MRGTREQKVLNYAKYNGIFLLPEVSFPLSTKDKTIIKHTNVIQYNLSGLI